MTIRRKTRKRSAPVVAVDETTDRGGVSKVLSWIVYGDQRTQEEIAGLAGITARHLRRVLDGQSPDTAVHVLRVMGYDVTETIKIKGEPDEDT